MCDNHNDLYLSEKDSDVTLVIGDAELPAHRSILSKGSEYFKTMFSSSFIEANSNRVELKDTNLNAFKVVLKYIYDHTVTFDYEVPIHSSSFDEILAIFECAHCYLVDDLAKEVLLFVKKNCAATQILDMGVAYSIDELITSSTCSIQMNAHKIVKNEVFEQLTPLAVEHLLKRRLNTQESTIFEALVTWMRANPENSALFPKLLGHIDLYLLEEEQLEVLFKPEELIDRNFCQDLRNQQEKQAQKPLKLADLDVIGDANSLRIVGGNIRWNDGAAIGMETECGKKEIIVDLKQQFLLNCLKLELKHNVSYTVSVSKDARTWERVIDRSKHICFGLQELYFEARLVRFIRFEKTSFLLIIHAGMKALYSTKSVEIDPVTTIIIPKQNVAPTKMAARRCIPPNSDISGAYICGNEEDDYFEHGIDYGYRSIILQLSQPYIIGSLKLLLKETSSYYIEIATIAFSSSFNKHDWTRVFTEENVFGWRIATFPKQPVVFIKIVGTKAPTDDFRLYKLECPAT